MKKFNELTKYIPKLEGDNFGQWVIDEVNDGSPEHPIQMPYTLLDDVADDFMDSLIKFCREHPEYEDEGYHDTLKENGIEWSQEDMESADVSNADAKLIIALLTAAWRADRFCEGVLLAFFNSGAIRKWLLRLEELDVE